LEGVIKIIIDWIENNMNEKISLLIITGPVGVGKSKVSEAVSEILSQKEIPNAVIDMDYLRCVYPSAVNDRFNTNLGYKNLTMMWPNYEEMGIRNLIIPNVVESKKEIDRFKESIPNAEITVIRLNAEVLTMHKRLENREIGDSLIWHKKRAVELKKQFEQKKLEDLVIETENKSINEVAVEVLSKWHIH